MILTPRMSYTLGRDAASGGGTALAMPPGPFNPKLRPVTDAFFKAVQPHIVRTVREFAEQEIVFPAGDRYEGDLFRVDRMPWTGYVLDTFSESTFRQFWALGPRQTGKTLLFFQIPVLYHTFEREQNVIIGVPKVELAQDIWDERLLPMIQASRYRDLLPSRGPGSRGGKTARLRFKNGRTLRFLSRGMAYTAPVVVLTEVDALGRQSTSTAEGPPADQIIACTSSFGRFARVYGEGITTVPDARIYQEVTGGSDTKVYLQCPHCKSYSAPVREHFTGWQEAETEKKAAGAARYTCPTCEKKWNEAQRIAALPNYVCAHKDQKVSKTGKVTGPAPGTYRFGMRWNRMHSTLTTMADIAVEEYRAEHSSDPDAMRRIFQYVWGEPYEQDEEKLPELTREIVLKKISAHQRRVVPPETERVTVGIDLGKYICWWVTMAWWGRAQGCVIDYGSFEVPQDIQHLRFALLAALREFRHTVLDNGWKKAKTERVVMPDLTMVDSGYEQEAAYDFVLEGGQRAYRATKGLGTNERDRWGVPAKKKGRILGDNWYIQRQRGGIQLVNMHSDVWKEDVYQGWLAPLGTQGSLMLYAPDTDKREHISFAKQMAAEKRVIEYQAGGKPRITWKRLGSRPNHWFDCAYACRIAADMLGVKLNPPKPPPTPAARSSRAPARRKRPPYKVGR